MRRLYRSRRDCKLFGLCGGLAEMMNVDPTLLRLIVVVTAFFSGGVVIPLYIIASLVIPKEPLFNDPSFGGGYGYNGAGYGGPAGGYYHGPAGHAGYNGTAYTGGNQGNTGYGAPHHGNNGGSFAGHTAGASTNATHLDEMMKDIEKKAMQKELEELRAKLAKYENDKNQSKGDQ